MNHRLDSAKKELIVTLEGDLLSTNVELARQEMFGLLESPAIREAQWDVLRLDLRAAKMIDSAGLNLIVALIKHVRTRGGRVISNISSPSIQRTFVFTRLDKQLELVAA